MEKNNELPIGWETTEFKKIVKKIPLTGKKLQKKEYLKKGKLPVIDQGQDLIGGYTDQTQLKANYTLPVIIFGDHTKIIKFIDQEFIAGADGVKVLEPKSPLNPKLIYYFTQAISIPNKGYARHYQYLEKSKIHIPPLTEQNRIVKKIEELFPTINQNIDLLESSKSKILVLRNSIFKKAFSGEYTSRWRTLHNTHVSKEELVAQVLSEVSKFKNKVVSEHLEKVSMPNLPLSWTYLSLDSLTTKIVDGTHFSPQFVDSGVSFISAKDIKNGQINFENCKFITKDEHEKLFKRCNPEFGDVLMSKSGSIGRTAVIHTKESFSLCESASLLKPLVKFLSPQYLSWFLEYYVKLHIYNQGLRGVGVQHFQLTDIRKIPIPLTTLDEQNEIVKILQFELSLLDEYFNSVEYFILKYKQLTKSLLKRAFEGKLVPQDPNDEPASKLLQQINQ